ncbi:DMT family transporter [Rhizocola hellebori]|uniref:DMT family transporter n=1 Tax=Rhizocola hellebori TaxID=1392758 RepID=UPI001942A67C|nr:DMT family transporter [Rhizocola hellebori]
MQSAQVFVAVMAAAALHASWNAIAKGVPDRFGLFIKSSIISVVIGAVLVFVVSPPAGPSWPWLLGSVGMHVLYNLGLMAAYQLGDFNQTYPLARGLGPVVVALVAATVLGEPLPPLATAGVVVIAAAIGVLGLTPWKRIRHNRSALTAAVLTGLAIATYTLLDGVGVRRSGSALGYAVWLLALHGLATMAAMALVKRSRWAPVPPEKAASWKLSVVAGVMSMSAYSLVLWAQSRGVLAAIAALRESSVVIAAIIGAIFFREPLSRLRITASLAVAAGVVLLALP